METIYLSNDGPELSRVALGMMRLRDWQLARPELCELIERCLELGLNTFDHADIYGGQACESLFGDAFSSMAVAREDVRLVTKCGIRIPGPGATDPVVKHYDSSRAYILRSVEGSLKRLRTGYVDLLLIHRPDPLMDAAEIAAAFTELRERGLVRFFGVSNFTPSQFDLLQSRLPFSLVTNQIECSVLQTEALDDGTLDACQRLGIAPMAWSPLGGGALFDASSKRASAVLRELAEIGKERGIGSIDRLAIAWLRCHPANIVPVIGTGNPERIAESVAASGTDISREDWFRILRASRGADVP
ncbi:MAG: aldo/keto reductase [Candidatus Krumholzibacteriota bacterium]|nr:aldo/keto reductase [Candidatus Krumholzibacteriota bacterium]